MFIKVHSYDTDSEICINSEHIQYIKNSFLYNYSSNPSNDVCTIYLDHDIFSVKESLEEVIKLLN